MKKIPERNSYKFIAICEEGGSLLGSSQLWQDACVEPLEKIIKTFLKTGSLIYTEIDLLNNGRQSHVEKKLYPKIDKLYLWGAVGKFRKRRKEWGNIEFLFKDL